MVLDPSCMRHGLWSGGWNDGRLRLFLRGRRVGVVMMVGGGVWGRWGR